MKNLSRFFAIAFLTVLLYTSSVFSQQTIVGHLSGGVAVLDVSTSTLETAFAEQADDGSTFSLVSIGYDGTDYYLQAKGLKSGIVFGAMVKLTNTNGNLRIALTAYYEACVNVNSSCSGTCSFDGDCYCNCHNGTGSCVRVQSPGYLSGHLGNFY
jgi:hypothetical protein